MVETQYCGMTMRAHTQVVKLKIAQLKPSPTPPKILRRLKLKKHLKGNHYDSDEEVVAAIRKW